MLLTKADIDGAKPAAREAHEQVALSVGGHVVPLLSVPRKSLEQTLPALSPEQLYTLPCHSTWSMAHLVEHLVKLVGPSDVHITSWTIKEKPVKVLLGLVDAGLITSISCLFDERSFKNNAPAAQLAERTMGRVGFTAIHAKCVVLTNATQCVTVCSTANLTRNKRIELYWLSTHRAVATYHREWIERILDNCTRRHDKGGT